MKIASVLQATIAASAISFTAFSADADLVRDGDIDFQVFETNFDSIPIPGGDFAFTFDDPTNTIQIVADQTGLGDPGEFSSITARALIPFSGVGVFPELATVSVDHDYKVVNSGGPSEPGLVINTSATVTIRDRGTFDPAAPSFADVGPILAAVNLDTTVNSNGLVIRDEQQTLEWVLVPEQDYVATVFLSLALVGDELGPSDPIAAGTLEAGAVSGFDGLTVSFNSVPVPEPTSLLLCGLGMFALKRRRA